MRVILLCLIILTNSLSVLANSEQDFKSRISQLKEFQEKVAAKCLNNPKAKDYFIEVDGQKLGCNELIELANQKREALALEIEAYEKSCIEIAGEENIDQLANESSEIAVKASACEPSPDKDHCVQDLMCSALALIPGANVGAIIAGKVSGNEKVKQCGNSTAGCAENILRGIVDSIWGVVSLVWEWGIKKPFLKMGELIGMVDKSEAKTSDRAMAAQTASPSFIERVKKDKFKVVTDFVADVYNSIKSAAMNHYGCQEWSAEPYFSTCLKPMENWDCATCQQKAQVFCGVGGYAVGEIVTAYITAGTFTAAKVALTTAVKGVSIPAKSIGGLIAKTFPKGAEKSIALATKIGTATAKGLTTAQQALIASFRWLEKTSVSRGIQKAAKAYHGSVLGLVTTKPIGLYLNAMDNAMVMGSKHAQAAIDETKGLVISFNQTKGFVISKGGQTARMSQEVATGKKIAEETLDIRPRSTEKPKVSRAAANTDDVVDDFARFSKDSDFKEFYAKFPEQSDDITEFLRRVEKERPDLSKAQVRAIIDAELKGECRLK